MSSWGNDTGGDGASEIGDTMSSSDSALSFMKENNRSKGGQSLGSTMASISDSESVDGPLSPHAPPPKKSSLLPAKFTFYTKPPKTDNRKSTRQNFVAYKTPDGKAQTDEQVRCWFACWNEWEDELLSPCSCT